MRTQLAALIFTIGALALAPGAVAAEAHAQAEAQATGSIYDQLKQSALTEAQIKQYIAAEGEMGAAMYCLI